MKELDVLLSHYVEREFRNASREQRQAFLSLLELEDPVIYSYCLQQSAPPANLAGLIERLSARRLEPPIHA